MMKRMQIGVLWFSVAAIAAVLPAQVEKSGGGTGEQVQDAKAKATPAWRTAAVVDAQARAGKDHKRVLLVVAPPGDLPALQKVLKTRAVQGLIRAEYEVVELTRPELVHGAKGGEATSFSVVGEDGKLLATQAWTAATKSGEVAGFLTEWQSPRLDAETVLKTAMADAKRTQRRVLVHLGAPWCGWCHRLEEFLGHATVAPKVAEDYVDVKIDTDRMTHGKKVAERLRGKRQGGIPWIVILDAEGKELVTSTGPKGNVGCPAQPHEVAWFLKMLGETRKRMSDEDLKAVEVVLNQFADKWVPNRHKGR